MDRPPLAPAALGLVLWLAGVAPGARADDRPQLPPAANPDGLPVVGARPPYDPDRSRQTLDFWTRTASLDPQGAIARRELAAAHLARGRETGAIAESVAAEAAARQSLAIMPRNNAPALQRLARALLGQHRFPEALEAADKATALNPAANRLRADILLELGDLPAARAALAKIPPEPDDLNLLALRARIAEAEGRTGESLGLMRQASRLADESSDLPHESAAWYKTMVGHALIDAGQLEPGERACRDALAIFPRDYRALTGLAEAATWRRDWPAAIRHCREALDIAPENPEAIRLLGEALDESGKPREAEAQYDAFRRLAASFPRIYDRHWVLFCADHGRDLDAALALARADLALRHDAHAYDTLAWACFKKGLLDEADALSRKARAGGVQDAGIEHHVAEIARARGDLAAADAHLARARALNPYIIR